MQLLRGGGEEEGVQGLACLLPFVDSANHDPSIETDITLRDGTFRLAAGQSNFPQPNFPQLYGRHHLFQTICPKPTLLYGRHHLFQTILHGKARLPSGACHRVCRCLCTLWTILYGKARLPSPAAARLSNLNTLRDPLQASSLGFRV